MRTVWVGFHVEGLAALVTVINRHGSPATVVTLDDRSRQRRNAVGDYDELCARHGILLSGVERLRGDAPGSTFRPAL